MNEENKKIDSQEKSVSNPAVVKTIPNKKAMTDEKPSKNASRNQASSSQLENPNEEEKTKREIPEVKPGMVVRVHQKIKDVDNKGKARERIQMFEGTVLACRGGKTAGATFTVRKKAVGGIWAEKIFPIHSPNVVKIEIVKIYKVRRAKLNYLRNSKKKLKQIKSQQISKKK